MSTKNTPQISNVEWGLVAGAGFTVDLVQWGLLLIGIGFFIDEFIEIFMALSLALYLWMRGQMGVKQAIGLIVGWFGEAGSDGAIPLWGLEIIYQMIISKSDKILEQVPGGQTVGGAIEKIK